MPQCGVNLRKVCAVLPPRGPPTPKGETMRKICLLALPLAIACGGSDSNTTTYVAQMNAANEKPAANSSPATGTATFTVDSTQTTVNFVVTYTGLSAGSTLSHIHAGIADVA